jgi:predicted esterase
VIPVLPTFALAIALTLPSPHPATTTAAQTPSQEVAAALIQLRDHMAIANKGMGEDQALDLGNRLAQDLEDYDEIISTYGADSASWNERMRNQADLDASIVAQVTSGKPEPIAGAHGLVERLITSTTDGTLQPFALYVPPTVGPSPTLVVLLHGRPQYESQIVAGPQFRQLADSTGTIIAAPYGRGYYDYYGIATDDVYQTASDVAAAYHIDPQKVYLVGYSMGAFSVFKIGPTHGSVWHGVMAIAGAILNSETAAVQSAFQRTPFYIVTGTADASIPSQYVQQTGQYLASIGIRTGLYIEKDGTHAISTLMPSLSVAWSDMLRGVVSHAPLGGPENLPAFPGQPDMSRGIKP